MNPETRRRLRGAWGFCDRHAWSFVQIEAAFRHGWLHGAAVLYDDLLDRTVDAFTSRPPWRHAIAHRLRDQADCLLCAEKVGLDSGRTARRDVLERGRDTTAFRAFAEGTRRFWEHQECARCLGQRGTGPWCRRHLVSALRAGAPVDLPAEVARLSQLSQQLNHYVRSFRWEDRDSDTDEDRGSLISAIGWCSGWTYGPGHE